MARSAPTPRDEASAVRARREIDPRSHRGRLELRAATHSAMATDTVGIIALMNVLATIYKGGRWRALPPVTLAYSGILLAVAAATGAGVVNFRALVLDDALVASEPWRLLGCLLAYERTLGFAAHLYLMVLVGEQLEPRLGPQRRWAGGRQRGDRARAALRSCSRRTSRRC